MDGLRGWVMWWKGERDVHMWICQTRLVFLCQVLLTCCVLRRKEQAGGGGSVTRYDATAICFSSSTTLSVHRIEPPPTKSATIKMSLGHFFLHVIILNMVTWEMNTFKASARSSARVKGFRLQQETTFLTSEEEKKKKHKIIRESFTCALCSVPVQKHARPENYKRSPFKSFSDGRRFCNWVLPL